MSPAPPSPLFPSNNCLPVMPLFAEADESDDRAWPIGVTMVGIHERSAREKLHESDKGAAHIMSDEVTRKFLQSIKRCLSFAQTRWPPGDVMQLMG